MIRVCVCDDDIEVVNRICGILDRISKNKDITMKVDAFNDGSSLLQKLDSNSSYYDVIFLDIEMKDMDGIETAKQLRKIDELAYIIYVSSYESYAIETFSVRPYQFVVKPFADEVIEKHFMDVYEKILTNDECYEFKFNNTYYKVLLKNIMYFESSARRIIIHLNDGKSYEYYDTLDKVEKKIENSRVDFLRIHKSTLVNSRFIKIKAQNEIQLMDGSVLAISEKKRNEINEHYMKRVEEKMRNGIVG